MTAEMNFSTIVLDIRDELDKAQDKFPAFNSAHEGYAVIAEELDELWDEVRINKLGTRAVEGSNQRAMYREAKQVAAMAIRFMWDICNAANKSTHTRL